MGIPFTITAVGSLLFGEVELMETHEHGCATLAWLCESLLFGEVELMETDLISLLV